jgi:hypothetical protein
MFTIAKQSNCFSSARAFRMNGAHLLLAVVCAVMVMFVWQIRKETDKWLYLMMGIGVGCAMAALIT